MMDLMQLMVSLVTLGLVGLQWYRARLAPPVNEVAQRRAVARQFLLSTPGRELLRERLRQRQPRESA